MTLLNQFNHKPKTRYLTTSFVKSSAKFLLLSLLTNSIIWGLVSLYIFKAPVKYTSTWSLILAGQGAQSSVNINSIGAEANTQAGSPFGSQLNIDPRANYKAIATSDEVINAAAQSLNIQPSEFGSVEVELVEPTATLQLSVQGSTTEEAYNKAVALQNAIDTKLAQLRIDENLKREVSLREAVNEARSSLRSAQLRLATFKTQTGFISIDQITNLSSNISELERQIIAAKVLLSQKNTELSQLQRDLQFKPAEVISTFSLQSDKVLQQSLSDYAEAVSQYTLASSRFTSLSPSVVNAEEKKKTIESQIVSRASLLLGKPLTFGELQRLLVTSSSNTNSGSSKDALYSSLVSSRSETQGLQAQYNSLVSQLARSQDRLHKLSKQEPQLEELQRNVQFAEAVYTSAIGKLNLSKVEIFSTYPLSQVLSSPSTPADPSSPKTTYAILGGLASSVIATTALGLLWLRHPRKFE